ncbi:hypothetical protein [Paraburkholderia sp. CNPSo 3076]|uniref:hypothetical protein n=1 Tax=Paraburkholderia sp. CNPSo 3076 TaxID=2940936 RepID=UPI003A5217AF
MSIATLDGPAKFSQFAGYDRTLLPHRRRSDRPAFAGRSVAGARRPASAFFR